jgi:hypothetical protein
LELKVGESLTRHGEKVLEPLGAMAQVLGKAGIVVVHIRGDELLCAVVVPGIDDLLVKAAHGDLIIFRRHGLSSFPTRCLRVSRLSLCAVTMMPPAEASCIPREKGWGSVTRHPGPFARLGL